MAVLVEFKEKELDDVIKCLRAYYVEFDNKIKKAPGFNKTVLKTQQKQAERAYNSVKHLMDRV